MAGQALEVRWSSDSARWGLFAKATILTGTKIYREIAVMHDPTPLNEVIIAWQRANKEERTANQAEKAVLEAEASKINKGMKTLRETVRNDRKYDAAMTIHKAGTTTAENIQPMAGYVPRLSLPMDLYKQPVDTKILGSEELKTMILQESLDEINTFYKGHTALSYPVTCAWGPQSALLNHGCNPNAAISCYRMPYSTEEQPSSLGVVGVHAVREIEKDEEITIAYVPVFGTHSQRQQKLRSQASIANCECKDCKLDDNLARAINDIESQGKLAHRNSISTSLNETFSRILPTMLTWSPVAFYHKIDLTLSQLCTYEYHGPMVMHLHTVAIAFAKSYNDNMRVHYFVNQLLNLIEIAFSQDHFLYHKNMEDFRRCFIEGQVWNENTREHLSIVPDDFEFDDEDRDIMFMKNHDASSTDHHYLSLSPEGRIIEVSRAENESHVVLFQLKHMAEQEEAQATRASAAAKATAEAESAAAVLTAEEEAIAAKKEKERARAQAKKARRAERIAKEEELAAAVEAAVAARLAERVAAVHAAVVVPALPLPAKEKNEVVVVEVVEEVEEYDEEEEEEDDDDDDDDDAEEEEEEEEKPVVAAAAAAVASLIVAMEEEGCPPHHRRFRSASAPALGAEEVEEVRPTRLMRLLYVDVE